MNDIKLKQHKCEPGDVVYKLNLALKIGENNKLKSVYSGTYVVSKVIKPVIIQIKNQKRTINVHHDNIKPCNDRNLPIWVELMRKSIFVGHETRTDPDRDLNIESLFNEAISKSIKIIILYECKYFVNRVSCISMLS